MFGIYLLFLAICGVHGVNITCASNTQKCPNTIYRSIDGSCNNLRKPDLGKSFMPLARLAPNSYADGVQTYPNSVDGVPLISARTISNALLPPGDNESKKFTIVRMQMGQFVAHDMSAIISRESPPNCCDNRKLGSNSNSSECGLIEIPSNDPVYNSIGYECLRLARSSTTKDFGCKNGSNEQINGVTSYIDISIVYGSTDDDADKIRERSGGRLKISKINDQEWPPTRNSPCRRAETPEETCFLNGDDRNNQNPHLLAVHIIFHREHNRIVNELAKLNPHWDDEKLFQEARKINIAQYQHVVFYELLPTFLGKKRMIKEGLLFPNAKECIDDYNEDTDPTTINEFSGAAWRYFHRRIVSSLKLFSKDRDDLGTTDLTEWMNRGIAMVKNSTLNYDNLVRGMTIQGDHEINLFIDNGVKCKMFKDASGFGFDLVSIDIQRGRDHGFVKYADALKVLGLARPKSWSDLKRFINKKMLRKLKTLYRSYKDIELFVGASFETKAVDADAGPTNLKIMMRQFEASRRGDRMFYENCENNFTNEQLNAIRKAKLARIICDNSAMIDIQPHVTKPISRRNKLRPCEEISEVDLSIWKEKCNEK